jgi:hypothetical protein
VLTDSPPRYPLHPAPFLPRLTRLFRCSPLSTAPPTLTPTDSSVFSF